MTILLTVLTGLVAGAGHVLSGPDHLAAIAPLAIEQQRGTWRVGLLWGLGHSGGVWLLAVLALVFREALPIDLLSSWGERLVGFVLIGVGLWGFYRMSKMHVHSHMHEHDGVKHVHLHVHEHHPDHHHPIEHEHTHSALGIGTLHGLAGTSHFLGILPALLLPSRLSAVAYVAAFGIGSIAAMTGFSYALGWLARRLHRPGRNTYRWLLGTCCTAAVAIGCYWCLMSLDLVSLPS